MKSSAKILVCDDDLLRISVFKKMLPEFFIGSNMDFALNYQEAVDHLKNDVYDVIFLDHDLGVGKTGYDVALWMKENIENPPDVIIHSMNPIGAKNILGVFPFAKWISWDNLLKNY